MSIPKLVKSATMALSLMSGSAYATDNPTYPDWHGQWERVVVRGVGEEAPLTPEYQAVLPSVHPHLVMFMREMPPKPPENAIARGAESG